MNYLEWNDIIAKKFFNDDMASREVLLYVNEESINNLDAEGNENVYDFIESIKTGPSWVTKREICDKALQSYENWRFKDFEYPPYIAYLAFFVLSATTEGDFNQKAYYPRFWELLSEIDRSGTPRQFYKTEILWEDLEKWSTEDKHEEWGRFTARIRGGMKHIGRPLSQTLFSDSERKYLPLIFDKAELDPTDNPSDDVMTRILQKYGENRFAKRTLRLLDSLQTENAEMKNALIEFVLDELTGWDGSLPDFLLDNQHSSQSRLQNSRVGLRICLKLDKLSGVVTSTLRLKVNRPFPDDGLNFEYQSEIYSCVETAPPNWSTKLKGVQPSKPFDAATIDWSNGAKFEDKENKLIGRLKASPVRLFLLGKREGLPDWIESQQLERGCEFLVACHNSIANKIREWGNISCEELHEKPSSGLPHKWLLFDGKGAHDSCEGIDVLTLSKLLKLRLYGGIKIGRSNSFLSYGPPTIILERGYGNEQVMLDGCELIRSDTDVPHWHLPGDAPVGVPLIIEVLNENGTPLKRRRIELKEPELPADFKDTPLRDMSGKILINDISVPYASGAIVAGIDPSNWGVFPHTLPTYLSKTIVFLGNKPGEIVEWPNEELPEYWHPVWAVAKSGKDKWNVHFCGQLGITEDNSKQDFSTPNKKAIKRWKEAVWYRRKRTNAPKIKAIKDMWTKCLEVAEHV